jgi:hypothetical protein
MPQIPILAGIVATSQAEFAQSYPLNLEPIALANGISQGQLRATAGAVQIGTGPGTDRGGIAWNNLCYRVMGTKLVTVGPTGTVTEIGDVGGTGPARLDYSFDRLGIRSGTALWFYNGAALAQVSDVDLGQVLDMQWIDGYWMATDGTSVVVTELSDPTSVLPLKYGSAEEDPDPITGLIKLAGEAYVLNRHTIQVFRNVGGNGFPFATNSTATIPYGCVSASAKCLYAGTFAFVGSARNEALRVYIAGQGAAQASSSRALDDALAALSDPTAIELEARVWRGEQRLLVHLPTETWIYCAEASGKVQTAIWYRATSGDSYRIRNAVQAYGKVIVGDSESAAIGELSDDTDKHFGVKPDWAFDTGLIYNEGKGALVHSVELVGLPGRGEASNISMSSTLDGQLWTEPVAIAGGGPGERQRRLQWRPHRRFTNYLGLRFKGQGGMPGFASIQADIRPLGT